MLEVRRTGSQQRPRRPAARMRTHLLLTLLCLLPLLSTLTIRAQQQVTLGNATAELTGPWKFHTGDNPAWADPNFDDSTWPTMDLTPPSGSFDTIMGTSGFVPGWTARGYPGYSGYAWYRLRLNVQEARTALALKMPDDFDDAYQVFVNGQLVGQFGRFTAHGVTLYTAQPRAFPLAADLRGGPVTISIRMWMAAYTPLVDPDAGGLHRPPVLGEASVIAGLLKLDWDAIDRSTYSGFFQFFILLLALLLAFGLYWLDSREPAYLWLGLTCAASLALQVVNILAYYTTWIDGTVLFLLTDAVLTPAIIGLWVLFWAYWFRLGRMALLHRAVWGLVVLLGIGIAMLRAPLYGGIVPVHAIVWLSPLTLVLKLSLGLLLVWVTVRGIRGNKIEGWLALPAVVLVILSLYAEELLVLHLPLQIVLFGTVLGIHVVSIVASLAIISILLLRRFFQAQRQREQLKQEIEQARQLQQVLIPEQLPSIPGYAVESEYRPAQQVGGDFFQIIVSPSSSQDKTILLIVGDVSGKGLQAAMLVSLIVGAIRMVAETTQDPITVLQALNRRLCGRLRGHFATCVVATIHPSGETTIANAGHLSPYLNGNEVPIAGSLPLGLTEDAEFEQTTLTLNPGDRLTLLTDGVVEAQDQQKNLFGFERTTSLLQQNNPASKVADAIQTFGQEDDITIISVTRTPTPKRSPASVPERHLQLNP